MIERLIKIANLLDQAGYPEEADFLDQLAKEKLSEDEEDVIEIPEDEYQQLLQMQEALAESLLPDVKLS